MEFRPERFVESVFHDFRWILSRSICYIYHHIPVAFKVFIIRNIKFIPV